MNLTPDTLCHADSYALAAVCAFGIIYNSEILYHGNCAFGTFLDAFGAGYAAEGAFFSCYRAFFDVFAGDRNFKFYVLYRY